VLGEGLEQGACALFTGGVLRQKLDQIRYGHGQKFFDIPGLEAGFAGQGFDCGSAEKVLSSSLRKSMVNSSCICFINAAIKCP
jgi:hypothetical protein